MITDEEAKKAAEVLKEYCSSKAFAANGCNDCIFMRSDSECLLDYYIPSDWHLESTK